MRPRDQITIVPPQRRLLRGQQANAGTQRAHNKGQNKIVKITKSGSFYQSASYRPRSASLFYGHLAFLGHNRAHNGQESAGASCEKGRGPTKDLLKGLIEMWT